LAEALRIVKVGLEKIHDFFAQFNSLPAYSRSNEVRVLRKFAKQLRGKIPVDEVTRLRGKLERAIKHEKYEEAAKLRDEINRRSASQSESAEF
jgi:protein-arginine kinase activator protein McsA